ncbi:MAG: homoserine O-succinyltransferase [Pseudomonadota bacterium]
MAIYLPEGLPAATQLRSEASEVCQIVPAATAEPRRLRILLLNLMPDKIATETQFARKLAGTGFPVELVLVKPASHTCKTASRYHVERFYRTWEEVDPADADGVIVTGAPIEHLPFSKVSYWEELCGVFNDARRFGLEQLYVCWAAQAALNHYYGVPKRLLPAKAFGVFPQQVFSFALPYMDGLSSQFDCPVSRHTEVRWSDLMSVPGLEVAAGSAEAGLCLVADQRNGAAYMFNHLEYDPGTLAVEYQRDMARCADAPLPRNYFPFDDPRALPRSTWDDAAAGFFSNWLRMAARRRMAHSFAGNAA